MKASLRFFLTALCIAAITGCADRPAPEATPSEEVAQASAPAGPAVPYRVEGACPFECCMYGEWTATRPLTAYAEAGDTTGVAFTIEPGATFSADTGYVAVIQTGLVVTSRPVEVYRSFESSRSVGAGDTLYLLDYVGEGVYNAWLADSVYQIEAAMPGDPAYRTLRDPEQTWWAHAVLADGRAGWLWMDENEDGAISGYDGCG